MSRTETRLAGSCCGDASASVQIESPEPLLQNDAETKPGRMAPASAHLREHDQVEQGNEREQTGTKGYRKERLERPIGDLTHLRQCRAIRCGEATYSIRRAMWHVAQNKLQKTKTRQTKRV